MALAQTTDKRYEKPVLLAANKPFEEESGLAALQDHPLSASLEKKDLDYILQHSRQVRLGHHQLLYRQAGDCFAEVMIYADPPRYACYAEALKNSEVLMIPVGVYQELIDREPKYARAALQHYAKRAVSRFHELEIMTVQSARDRLIRYLIDLLPEQARQQGGEVELPLPKCLVASRLAMQPETFSRILADLKGNGLVRVNRSKLFISDPMRLIQISQ